MADRFERGGKWLGKVIVEAMIAAIVVAGGTAAWAWWKGLPFHWAVLVGIAVIVGLALAVFLVSLAVVKFRGQVAQTSEHPNSDNENKQLEQMTESLRRGLEREAGLDASRQIAERNCIDLEENIEKEKAWSKSLATQLQAAQTEITLLKPQVCSENWLHTISEYEKNAIDTRLRVIDGHIWKTRLDEQPYEIEFNFDVINSAVYPVTFKELPSTARIKFAHKTLLYPPTIQMSADAFLHGNAGWFHLTQQLTEGEYERYKNADGQCSFEFRGLKLEIKGAGGFEGVVESRFLRMPFIITKADERFLAPG